MNLRSLLRRRSTDALPQLPVVEPEEADRDRIDERLERLLTPTELELVRRHRV
ncbi:hypothetical protein [Nocardia paucivorans]|uniref:hypothetical protein n=1 Tax=Nocardia paucivorans TaxID=114259 RepID=UPI0002F790C1|nr:hypothetical protein [Nocardia paucivorans]